MNRVPITKTGAQCIQCALLTVQQQNLRFVILQRHFTLLGGLCPIAIKTLAYSEYIGAD
jgi:hypothetical protein